MKRSTISPLTALRAAKGSLGFRMERFVWVSGCCGSFDGFRHQPGSAGLVFWDSDPSSWGSPATAAEPKMCSPRMVVRRPASRQGFWPGFEMCTATRGFLRHAGALQRYGSGVRDWYPRNRGKPSCLGSGLSGFWGEALGVFLEGCEVFEG